MKSKNEERCYAKIQLEYDSENKKVQKQVITGDEETIASLLGAAIHHLIESGFDKEILEYAVKQGFETEEKKVKVTEIHISKDNEKELKDLLKKLGVEV